MRVTSKGQVTIPVSIRERFGFLPNTEVAFEVVATLDLIQWYPYVHLLTMDGGKTTDRAQLGPTASSDVKRCQGAIRHGGGWRSRANGYGRSSGGSASASKSQTRRWRK